MLNKVYTIRKDKLFYGLVLLLISPVMGLYASIRNFRFKESRLIMILFFAIFGMTMIVQEGKDAKVHEEYFLNSYVGKDFKTFIEESKNIISFKPNANQLTNDDLYLHVVSFLAAKISSYPSVLFLIVSFIYGIFYVRGLNIVYQSVNHHKNFIFIILLFLFIFWKSLEGINSIRNWTAAWIFFNGAFSYFQTKEKKFLFLVLVSPMVHFAYIVITLPFFVVLILGNWPKLYTAILIISFFLSIENVSSIKQYLFLTELGSQKVGYLSEEATNDYLREGGAEAFHAKYYLVAVKLALSIIFYYAILFLGYLKKKKHNYLMLSLASLGILMVAFSNFVTFLPVLNKRIFTNGGLYMLSYLLLLYDHKFRRHTSLNIIGFDVVTYLCLPLIVFFIFTQLSHIGDFTDARIFISPLIYWLFEGDNSLKELLRSLLT